MGKEICDACARPVGGDNTRLVGRDWICPSCEQDMDMHSNAGLVERMTKTLDDIKEACEEVKERNRETARDNDMQSIDDWDDEMRGYEYFADDVLAIIERSK
tara:strand:- start:849 stop:1154 length:306 start_codon:yes stop_codon:yes gene_type:complete